MEIDEIKELMKQIAESAEITSKKEECRENGTLFFMLISEKTNYCKLLLSAKSFNKKKERADSLIVESAQIVTFVFCDETSIT